MTTPPPVTRFLKLSTSLNGYTFDSAFIRSPSFGWPFTRPAGLFCLAVSVELKNYGVVVYKICEGNPEFGIILTEKILVGQSFSVNPLVNFKTHAAHISGDCASRVFVALDFDFYLSVANVVCVFHFVFLFNHIFRCCHTQYTTNKINCQSPNPQLYSITRRLFFMLFNHKIRRPEISSRIDTRIICPTSPKRLIRGAFSFVLICG